LLIFNNIALEICPTSNIALEVYPDYQHHPFRKIYDSGISLSINTDDPPFFETNMSKEYDIVEKYYGLTEQELLNISKQAIHCSFAEPELKERLLRALERE